MSRFPTSPRKARLWYWPEAGPWFHSEREHALFGESTAREIVQYCGAVKACTDKLWNYCKHCWTVEQFGEITASTS
jgi:hypothetical protein